MPAETPHPPADAAPAKITYRDMWVLIEQDFSAALILSKDFATRAEPYEAQGHNQRAAELRSIAAAKRRRAEIYYKLCSVLDLIIDDPPTIERIKQLATAKREREEIAKAAAMALPDDAVYPAERGEP